MEENLTAVNKTTEVNDTEKVDKATEVDKTEADNNTTAVNDSTPESTGKNATEPETKTFTQDEVNGIIGDRLERANKKFLERYGVNSFEELDAKIEKSNGYDVAMSEKANLEQSNLELNKRIAYIVNSIDDNRIGDIEAIFKSKGLEINDENLKAELSTHPEWAKKPQTITELSFVPDKKDNEPNDNEQLNKYFGTDF